VKINAKKFFIFPVEFDAVYYKNVLNYTINCGTYKFDLTQDEAEQIYEKIKETSLFEQMELENLEIESRFKKYDL